MKNTIKHLICSFLSGLLCSFSILIGLGFLTFFGEAYRSTRDNRCIVYTILSIAVCILVYSISIKLATHRTKEDKQRLYDRLVGNEPTNSELAYLIETGNIEAIREKYDLSEDINDDDCRTRN